MNKLFLSTIYQSPIGQIAAVSSLKGLRQIIIGPAAPCLPSGDPFNAISQIKAYFDGHSKSFNLPLDLIASDFTKKVLEETSKIPFGQTSTYGQIAKAINNPNATRAVGGALNRNPIPIIIPCHRVLAKGSLGGFALGDAVKKMLLEIEGTQINAL